MRTKQTYFLLDKAKQVEAERTQKWLKMTKAWDKYYGGEKVSVF